LAYGLNYWHRAFEPRGNALLALGTPTSAAVLTVVVSLAVEPLAG
jgi:hypothetical protein